MAAAPQARAPTDPFGVGGAPLPPLSREARARFGQLLKAQFSAVFRTLRRLGVAPSACEDAAQEVFLVVARKLADVEPERERAFLFGIAARVAANRRRSQATRREVSDAEVESAPESQPLPDALMERKRLRELLDRVLDELPSELRAVFVLVELEGMSAREIAESLEMPPGTVASRLRRARELFSEIAARVRAELQDEESSR
jgi:RNA polymerase sigma-70 factor, ECF subfamily